MNELTKSFDRLRNTGNLIKAKYIKRIPKAGGGYKYFYGKKDDKKKEDFGRKEIDFAKKAYSNMSKKELENSLKLYTEMKGEPHKEMKISIIAKKELLKEQPVLEKKKKQIFDKFNNILEELKPIVKEFDKIYNKKNKSSKDIEQIKNLKKEGLEKKELIDKIFRSVSVKDKKELNKIFNETLSVKKQNKNNKEPTMKSELNKKLSDIKNNLLKSTGDELEVSEDPTFEDMMKSVLPEHEKDFYKQVYALKTKYNFYDDYNKICNEYRYMMYDLNAKSVMALIEKCILKSSGKEMEKEEYEKMKKCLNASVKYYKSMKEDKNKNNKAVKAEYKPIYI